MKRWDMARNGWDLSQTNPLPPRFASILLNRSISCLTLMTHSDERNRPMMPAIKPYVVENTLFRETSACLVTGVTQKLVVTVVLSELANVEFWQKFPPNSMRSPALKYPQQLNSSWMVIRCDGWSFAYTA